MKELLLMFASLLILVGCSQEASYLREHDVALYSHKLAEARKYRITALQASDIYIKFIDERTPQAELDAEREARKKEGLNEPLRAYPNLVIDDHYVYSFHNMKMQQIAAFGVWINANTGEIKHGNDEIWLHEKAIK